jgi:putative transposase
MCRQGLVNLLSGLSNSLLVCHPRRLKTPATHRDKPPRFPAESISHAVWVSFRFCLSDRDVEARWCARGGIVTDEAMRQWWLKCGQAFAHQLRRRRPRPGDTWPLAEVVLTSTGARPYLWRAVDHDGKVLDILVQPRRHTKAAKQFFRTRLTGCHDVPRVLVTDQRKSSGAAKPEGWPRVDHRPQRDLHHRADNAHQPTRQRARRLQGVNSPGHAQRVLAVYGPSAQDFRPRRPLFPAPEDRQEMGQRVHPWQAITSLPTAA